MAVQRVKQRNQIIDIMVIKIYIDNNVVEFDPSEKSFKETFTEEEQC